MSATERLRALLDERGVEHEGGERSVRWRDHNGVMMQAFPLANGELGMGVWSCTPEQAIAATLGPCSDSCNCTNDCTNSERMDLDAATLGADARPTKAESSGTLTAEKVRELMEENSRQYPSPTDPYVWLTEYDWQAIADELNTTLRRGTCHDVWDTELTGRLRFQCSECGAVSLEIAPRFCPACGREVVADG